jgi:alpha-tubulin suppressor-like RCC1 family protein
MTVAFDGLNAYGQCNVPADLSNAVAIAGGNYFSLALTNGKVIGWGDNAYGQTIIPAPASNVVGIAAGVFHGVAVLANGSVTNWGYYWDGSTNYTSVTNRTYANAPPLSNVVAVAAGMGQDLALLSNGTCVAWGFTNVYGTGAAYGTQVPTNLNLTSVAAIACGDQFNVALQSNGMVTAWGASYEGDTTVPASCLSNVAAIAAGAYHSLALLSNGTVVAWGDNQFGETNVPVGLSNVVAIAAGGDQSLALQANRMLVAWGAAAAIPEGMSGVKAISAGFDHNMVIESGIMNPVIFRQPTDQYGLAGGNVTFSAAGQGVAGVTYQWQLNGTNITGATMNTLTLTNVAAANNGNYDVVVTTSNGSITSSVATFTLVVAPQIGSTYPTVAGTTWINYPILLHVAPTNAGQLSYPLSFGWQFNGTNIPGESSSNYLVGATVPTNDGNYMVSISNAAGSTNVTWNIRLALPGMLEAWGDNTYDECDRPATMTNAAAIAAGEYQSLAVTDSGTVVQWGEYNNGTNFYPVTDTSVATLAPTSSNLVTVAAGMDHAIALATSSTVLTWGITKSLANYVPATLTNATAIASGWYFDVALLPNGTVTAWGSSPNGQTNVPPGLSEVVAIAAGPMHTLALQSIGKVVAWGYATNGETTVPSGLSNVVAIAAGRFHSLALLTNGTVVAWGAGTSNNPSDGYDFGQSMVPAGLSNVMAIAAGDFHSVALLNTNVIVEWGDNSSGQATAPTDITNTAVVTYVQDNSPFTETNTYPPMTVKSIAAGGYHTMATILSSLVQYPVNVSKDLLLIYNTNSLNSSTVFDYYLANRPMASTCSNILAMSCLTNEQVSNAYFTGVIEPQIQTWISNNPTKRPSYVVLFPDIPSRPDATFSAPSTQVQINNTCVTNWHPFVSSINMNGTGGTNDCIAYIKKIMSMASNNAPGSLLISATAARYGNTNWYFDDSKAGGGTFDNNGYQAELGVLVANPYASVFYSSNAIITNGTNVAGYYSPGVHNGYFTSSYPTNLQIVFSGASEWYLIQTDESYNGLRVSDQGNFLGWYASNAFGGSNYSCTPIGAVCHVEEPGTVENSSYVYFGLWAQGNSFASCAWNSYFAYQAVNEGYGTRYLQVVGDPFVTK